MSVKEKTYPNDPLDVGLGCFALILMVATPCLFVWGVFTITEWTTWWKIGVSIALFFIIANGWLVRKG